MNTKLLEIVTPSPIYHGCSTWKTFWEEYFTPVNMKNCGCRNVRKHREIKYGRKYITLDISLNFGSLEKMKINYLEPKYYLRTSVKGLITSLGINTIRSPKKKSHGMPLLMPVLRIFLILLSNLRI